MHEVGRIIDLEAHTLSGVLYAGLLSAELQVHPLLPFVHLHFPSAHTSHPLLMT
jgi:hypothetical protein